ncbi:hypothetical protein [Trichocoleus sp. FACHB-262]|uniref:hypothetical protein n=1 Tax=Trichocoleus sp. FACHB-262 TaxID=2692869 RepID=UPI001683688B|nr:hypothetical protein [Trichocoleus sp. FACHB-262]MBD2120772.1 hypothetical protein [Trichocoleus sp. FACHB-262]
MIKSTPALMCFPEDLQRDRSLFKPQTAVLANFEQLSTLKRLARRTPKEISFNFISAVGYMVSHLAVLENFKILNYSDSLH